MLHSVLMTLQEHAAGGEGLMQKLPPPFQPSWGLAFWTLIVFGLLTIALAKFAYPWIVETTVAREEKIRKQLAEAQQLHADAAAQLEEQRKLLAAARGEAQALVTEARQAAERERSLGIEKTRQEQDELLARARREIEAERERAVVEIRREAVDLAIAAAAKVVGERLQSAEDRKLIEEYLTQIGTGA
jgi:F-type H+-transporting ATPase subunit b